MLRRNPLSSLLWQRNIEDNSCHAVRDIFFLISFLCRAFFALTQNSGASEKKFKNYLYSYTVVGNQISKRELFQESSLRCD